ncbi:MAG: twin-arginine translocase subunit TatC [Bryobacteraceae bacterium]
MSSDEHKEAPASPGGESPVDEHKQDTQPAGETHPVSPDAPPRTDDVYPYNEDPYNYADREYGQPVPATPPTTTLGSAHVPPQAGALQTIPSAPPAPPPPPSKPVAEPEPEEDEDDGMLRMSFLEHLEELRSRLIRALAGFGVAFLLCLTFTEKLWVIVQTPAAEALTSLGLPPNLVILTPMEGFNVIWLKLPVLISIFIASPWILYQVWAFIAPGLYSKERRWAIPFIVSSAGLFISGGLFAYFVAFRFGLTFLLGIGRGIGVVPLVSISEYFDLFVNVILGIALVFELPVLIFFLTLLRIASPRFLLSHSRYAILGIVILAAIITPTPDVFNLTIFAAPMIGLYFVGLLASYLLVLHRENKRLPWGIILSVLFGIMLLVAACLFIAITRYGFHFLNQWPFLVR